MYIYIYIYFFRCVCVYVYIYIYSCRLFNKNYSQAMSVTDEWTMAEEISLEDLSKAQLHPGAIESGETPWDGSPSPNDCIIPAKVNTSEPMQTPIYIMNITSYKIQYNT